MPHVDGSIRLIKQGVCPRSGCAEVLREVDPGTLKCDGCGALYAKPEDRPWERED